jgi:uncharacterized protein (TIGR02391 family)
MDKSECDEKLMELGKHISKIKSAITLVSDGEIFDGEDDYIHSYHMIKEHIETLNSECGFKLKHLNYYEDYGDLLTLKLNRDNVDNYLKDWYESLEKQIRRHLNGIDSSFWIFIHPEIIRVSKNKFEDGYCADAVESAFKEVNNRVKDIYKNKIGEERDGKDLMNRAFKYNPNDPNSPVIQINDDLSTQDGLNLQEGYQHIFAGSIQCIRNIKAHNNHTITEENGMHKIILASMLMYTLDNSTY